MYLGYVFLGLNSATCEGVTADPDLPTLPAHVGTWKDRSLAVLCQCWGDVHGCGAEGHPLALCSLSVWGGISPKTGHMCGFMVNPEGLCYVPISCMVQDNAFLFLRFLCYPPLHTGRGEVLLCHVWSEDPWALLM